MGGARVLGSMRARAISSRAFLTLRSVPAAGLVAGAAPPGRQREQRP